MSYPYEPSTVIWVQPPQIMAELLAGRIDGRLTVVEMIPGYEQPVPDDVTIDRCPLNPPHEEHPWVAINDDAPIPLRVIHCPGKETPR